MKPGSSSCHSDASSCTPTQEASNLVGDKRDDVYFSSHLLEVRPTSSALQ